jgi:hypothetical protein
MESGVWTRRCASLVQSKANYKRERVARMYSRRVVTLGL